MSPITHFLTGWVVANASTGVRGRERAMITIAAVAPDVDAIGLIPELLTRHSANPILWYSEYHHQLGHNLTFGLLLVAVAFGLSVNRVRVMALTLLSFHLHLLCDALGSRGPDGYQWPIPYLWPFSDAWQWSWDGQWELNAWPNFAITITELLIVLFLAWKRGRSPLEMISASANKAFVEALRRRFPGSD